MTDFLKLVKGLSLYNDGQYDGFVIGKAEWWLGDCIYAVESKIRKKKMGYVIAEINGYGRDYFAEGKLVVTMLKGKMGIAPNSIGLAQPDWNLYPSHRDVSVKQKRKFCFHQKQVDAYLETVRDTNPIHRGPHAVVPGLMLLGFLLASEDISGEKKCGSIRFRNPLTVDTPFIFRKQGANLEILSESEAVCYAEVSLYTSQSDTA